MSALSYQISDLDTYLLSFNHEFPWKVLKLRYSPSGLFIKELLLRYYSIGMLLIAMTCLSLNHLLCLHYASIYHLFFFRIKGYLTARQKLIKSIFVNKAFVPQHQVSLNHYSEQLCRTCPKCTLSSSEGWNLSVKCPGNNLLWPIKQ